nr:hypothetical protein [Staphylococcus hominis]
MNTIKSTTEAIFSDVVRSSDNTPSKCGYMVITVQTGFFSSQIFLSK